MKNSHPCIGKGLFINSLLFVIIPLLRVEINFG
jgi:hypothetical protein